MKSADEVNDLSTIMRELKEDLMKFMNEEDIIFYKTTSKDRKDGESNREAFYNDTDLLGNSTDGKLQIMFAINQYNEGVHTPNIDGIILGRTTTSDIVYFEQVGRALSVSSKTSPVIIDLVNNVKFIKELETNLKDRKRLRIEQHISNPRTNSKELLELEFDISMENIKLYNILEELAKNSELDWEGYYELIKKYYQAYQHSNVPEKFKTFNGVEEDCNGIKLGEWTLYQRVRYNKLSTEQKDKLLKINFSPNLREEKWNSNYLLVKKYYETNGHLKVPLSFKTLDGVTEDKDGINIYSWLRTQRTKYNELSEEKQEKLVNMGFVIEYRKEKWDSNYYLAKKYYEKNGDIKLPKNFRTLDGVTEDKDGINIYSWLSNQRVRYNELSDEKKEKLLEINFSTTPNDDRWDYYYNLLKKYYETNGCVKPQKNFKTLDGVTEDKSGKNIYYWFMDQRQRYENLSSEQKEKLLKINFTINESDDKWEYNYNLVEKFYEINGHIKLPLEFKTMDGITEDEEGPDLCSWLYKQRKKFDKLAKEKQLKLQNLGFVVKLNENKRTLEMLCTSFNVNYKKYKKILELSSVQFIESKIMFLLDNNIPIESNGTLHEIFTMTNQNMILKYGVSMEELYNKYITNKQK